MSQLFIVILIIIVSIGYIAYRTYVAIRDAESGCYGCKGCALKEQMIKKHKQRKGQATTFRANQCSNYRKKTLNKV